MAPHRYHDRREEEQAIANARHWLERLAQLTQFERVVLMAREGRPARAGPRFGVAAGTDTFGPAGFGVAAGNRTLRRRAARPPGDQCGADRGLPWASLVIFGSW